MLTARAWWLLFVDVLLVLFGIWTLHTPLVIVGLTVLLWFAWEWVAFAVRLHVVAPKLYVERTITDERGPVTTLWAGRVFRVQTMLRLPRGLRLPFVLAVDPLPFAAERIEELQRQAGTQSEVHIVPGDPAEALRETALEIGADLLVVGRSAASGLLGRLSKNSYSIISRSPCPVVSV